VTVLRSHEAAESSEETVHLLGRDTEALIDDRDTRDAVARGGMTADLAAVRRELDRVVKEISQDRLDPARVDVDTDAAVRQVHVEAMA
jgi:hypothetical protein